MVIDTELLDNTSVDDGYNTLRERLRIEAETQALSMAAVARLAGVGESTLSAFNAGNYSGNNARVADKVTVWLNDQDARARSRSVSAPPIPFTRTRTTEAFLGALEHAQTGPDMAVLVGGAGVGKTTAANRYQETHSNVFMITAEPSLSSSYAVLDYLGDVLGVAEVAAQKRSRAISTRLRGTQGLLIVDEAQHLSIGAIDQLRAIHDRAQIGMALLGNEEVWSRIDGGGRKAQFAQLFSRVGMRVITPRPTPLDIEAILDAAEVLDRDQRGLLRVIAGKPGALRAMVKTLNLARKAALGADEPLSVKFINAAWQRLSGSLEAQA